MLISKLHRIPLLYWNIFAFIAGCIIGANLIEVCRIFEEQNPNVPMSVDHGRTMLGDEDKGYNAGYSFHGRMMGLAQMDGVMATVKYLKNKS